MQFGGAESSATASLLPRDGSLAEEAGARPGTHLLSLNAPPASKSSSSSSSSSSSGPDWSPETAAAAVAAAATHGAPKVYRMRWYVLAVYSAFTTWQSLQWAIFGPTSDSVEPLYGWTDDDITLLANWGPIMFIIFSFPFSFLIDRSLRLSVLFSCFLVAISAVIRVVAAVAFDPKSSAVLGMMHLAQILNAIAGPASMGAVGKLSQDWFPTEERTLAVAIASEANLVGSALAFVIGPYALPTPDAAAALRLWIYILIPTVLTLLTVFLHFPSHPPTSPSVSAEVQRGGIQSRWSLREFGSALCALATNGRFWTICCSYGLTTGVFSAWGDVMAINLRDLDYDQTAAGWISFIATMAGSVGGIVLGRVSDKMHNPRVLLVWLLFLTSISATIFALACTGGQRDAAGHLSDATAWIRSVFPLSLPLLFAMATLTGLFLNSTIPLFFDLSIEATFPIAEGTVITMLTNMNNLGTLIFLSVPLNSTGTAWMNWGLAGSCVFFTFAMFFFRSEMRRLQLDEHTAPAKDAGDEEGTSDGETSDEGRGGGGDRRSSRALHDVADTDLARPLNGTVVGEGVTATALVTHRGRSFDGVEAGTSMRSRHEGR